MHECVFYSGHVFNELIFWLFEGNEGIKKTSGRSTSSELQSVKIHMQVSALYLI